MKNKIIPIVLAFSIYGCAGLQPQAAAPVLPQQQQCEACKACQKWAKRTFWMQALTGMAVGVSIVIHAIHWLED